MSTPNHLYIHIPFCNSFCAYCDFKKTIANEKIKNRYIKKITNQIDKKYANKKFKTIYIGGGTPNCLNNYQLNYLLKHLRDKLSINGEFTIECNPELITKDQAQIFLNNNVNRISLGIQTTNNKLLKLIGRTHTIEDAKKAIYLLHQFQIKNISADFIYGFNELTLKDFDDVFNFIKNQKLKHVSFYSLEIKDGTKF